MTNTVFSSRELSILARLTSPIKIQHFLDALPYSDEERYRCPRSVLRDRKAHCYDGAVFAATAMRLLGYPPLLVEILPNHRDDDHILAVFRNGKHWGAIAKSNFVGLRFREPVYRGLRELVMSYFESYFNVKREKTLVGYTTPLNLSRFDRFDWMVHDDAMDVIADGLDKARRHRVLTPSMERQLSLVDKRFYEAGLLGANPKGLLKL
jgi:hypothetical protein